MKTYLRATVSQKRLNHVMVTHIHKHRTSSLDIMDMAHQFTQVNSRHREYFGTFTP